jgi:hypothetical protein
MVYSFQDLSLNVSVGSDPFKIEIDPSKIGIDLTAELITFLKHS